MGSVYEAERIQGDPEAGAADGEESGRAAQPHVALKLIAPELLRPGDSVSLGRFRREARAASAIDTEHIVRVLDLGTDPATGAPYMVMELLPGEDLEQILHEVGMLRPDTALRIAAQVCRGLEKAHQARIIHRDIKPANIFLARGEDGSLVVKILDFGIAKIKPEAGALTSGLTVSGILLGSPLYMSPEQAKNDAGLDFRSDLWSLGVVLYQALSGKVPHHELQSLGALVLGICTTPPRRLQERAPWVPPEVAAVVHKALALDPNQRFPSATAMLEAIRPLLPSGWELDEQLLVAPGDETRKHVAPRSLSGRRLASSLEVTLPALAPEAAAEQKAAPSGVIAPAHLAATLAAPALAPATPDPGDADSSGETPPGRTLAGSLWERLWKKGPQ